MSNRGLITFAAALAASTVVAVACLDDTPRVFAQKALAPAKAEIKGTAKILVVKATASWCGPCKLMNKTTWRDEKVEAWFKSNGTAIELDVDKQTEDAKALHITAMPTMIAFKAGKDGAPEEFDRVVGYMDADALLGWLGKVQAGERHADEINRKADDAAAGKSKLSGQERYDLARELFQAGRHDRATTEYVWLWDHVLDDSPAMMGVRLSFMAQDMKKLARQYRPALEQFTQLRDREGKKLEDKGAGDATTRADWITLNDIVNDTHATLSWFDTAVKDPTQKDAIRRSNYQLNRLLEEHGRWADMGRLVEDAELSFTLLTEMNKARAGVNGGDKKVGETMEKIMQQSFREGCAKLYASLLAAGRDKEAASIRGKALEADGSQEMKTALEEFAAKAKK